MNGIEKQWAHAAVNVALRRATPRREADKTLRMVANAMPEALEAKIAQLKTMVALLESHLPHRALDGQTEPGEAK